MWPRTASLLALPLLLCANAPVYDGSDPYLSKALECSANQGSGNLGAQLTDQMIASLRDPDKPPVEQEVIVRLLSICGLAYVNDEEKLVAFGFGAIGVLIKEETGSRMQAGGYDPESIETKFRPLLESLSDDELDPTSFAPPASLRPALSAFGKAAQKGTTLKREEFAGLFGIYVIGLILETMMVREFDLSSAA